MATNRRDFNTGSPRYTTREQYSVRQPDTFIEKVGNVLNKTMLDVNLNSPAVDEWTLHSGSGETASDVYGDQTKFDTFTMPDGTVLQNPYKLDATEYKYYQDYKNGKFYILLNERRAAEAAYNKYLQYQSWWEQQQNTYFATDYNSEQSQVERYEEAGLNADLLGIGSSQTTAATATSPSPVQVGAGQSDFASLTSSIVGVLGVVSSAVGLGSQIIGVMSGLTGLNQAKENVRGTQLENASSIVSLVDSLYDFLPDSFFETQIDDVGDIDAQTDILASSIMTVASGLGLDEKTTAAVDKFLRSPSSSSIMKRWQNRHQAEVERQQYYWNHEDPYRYTPNNADFEAIRQMDANLKRLEIEYQSALNEYNKTVVSNTDPSIEASMMNAKHKSEAANYNVIIKGKEIVDEYLSNILAMATSGSGFGQATAMLAYQSMQSGGNLSLSGSLAMLSPYAYGMYEEISGWIQDPSSMPEELKKMLPAGIGVGGAALAISIFLKNYSTGMDLIKGLL